MCICLTFQNIFQTGFKHDPAMIHTLFKQWFQLQFKIRIKIIQHGPNCQCASNESNQWGIAPSIKSNYKQEPIPDARTLSTVVQITSDNTLEPTRFPRQSHHRLALRRHCHYPTFTIRTRTLVTATTQPNINVARPRAFYTEQEKQQRQGHCTDI